MSEIKFVIYVNCYSKQVPAVFEYESGKPENFKNEWIVIKTRQLSKMGLWLFVLLKTV